VKTTELSGLLSKKAGGRIYHAAQLRDLRTYAALGHVASRAELFERGPAAYTPFDSDADDVAVMNCDNDVFGNLLDQGQFMKSGRGIPNAYGPITLVFPHDALLRSGASEVSVRRNAIWRADDEGRRVLDPDAIDALYDANGWARGGEVQIVGGTLYLADVMYVLVNPISVNGTSLTDEVVACLAGVVSRRGQPIKVYERSLEGKPGGPMYEKLVAWAAEAPQNGGDVGTLPTDLAAWFASVTVPKKDAQVKRFANYLSHGTISAVEDHAGHLPEKIALLEDERPEDDWDIYFDNWDAERFGLSDEQIADRDIALAAVDRAEFHLRQALRRDGTGVAPDVAVNTAWQEFLDALSDLNYWIETTRCGILGTRDEFHTSSPDAHDSEASVGMSAWADEFDEIDVPWDADPLSVDLDEIPWRDVREYSTQSLHL